MSFQAVVTKLGSPIKDLILSATHDGTQLLGKSEQDKADVCEWVAKVGQGQISEGKGLEDLSVQLIPRTYAVSNYLTAADVALFGALHPILSKMQSPQYYTHPALLRYFDHIQSQPIVRKAADSLAPSYLPVQFDLDNAPKLERKFDLPKKEKAPKATSTEVTSSNQNVAVPNNKDGKAREKEVRKKEKAEKRKEASAEPAVKQKAAGGEKANASAESSDPLPSMIDLRVGRIVEIKKHPDADGLYVEQIDLAEESGPRTVVSGLVNYIPIEEMRDKYVVTVCNLKPVSMRGIKSFAMVLCATSKEGKEGGIELVQPPVNSKPGDRVYFEGAEFENATPVSQLNPKKKIFETIQPGFTTLETREAAWVNPVTNSIHKIRTKNGVCVAPTFVGASLS